MACPDRLVYAILLLTAFAMAFVIVGCHPAHADHYYFADKAVLDTTTVEGFSTNLILTQLELNHNLSAHHRSYNSDTHIIAITLNDTQLISFTATNDTMTCQEAKDYANTLSIPNKYLCH